MEDESADCPQSPTLKRKQAAATIQIKALARIGPPKAKYNASNLAVIVRYRARVIPTDVIPNRA
jgi:hypothetical protein